MAASRVGGMLASVFFCVATTICLAIAIIAFVGRGELRCFAIGFLIPLLVYFTAHMIVGASELDPYRGVLPTTRWTRPVFEAVVRRDWVDLMTGEVIADYNPAAMPARHEGGGMLPAGVGMVTRRETPPRDTFMLLMHLWTAMLGGYAGGKFAVAVRRHQDAVDGPP